MGITFKWFKGYNIINTQDYRGISYFLSLIDWNATEHSAGNVIRVRNVFENITGKSIPIIDCNKAFDSQKDAEKYIDSMLIDTNKMSAMCSKILLNTEINNFIKNKVERFKDLSDKGYYIAYDAV